MKHLFTVLILIASIAGFTQTTSHSYTYDGQTRTYRVYRPVSFNASENLPLVINMHGRGSNSTQQELYSLFNDIADTARCVVVYPDGINNLWDVVIGCSGSSTPCLGVDDVGFISSLIDTMQKNYNIDLSRVYATGMSMGGYMSFRLACELSCRIAAIASVTGLMQEAAPLHPACNPSRKVPVMQFHGTADAVVPYTSNPPVASVSSTLSRWQTINGCSGSPTITNLPNTNTTDGCSIAQHHYGVCGDSTLVIHYKVDSGGHTWPGSNPLANIGVTNRDINASSIIWNFFKRYKTNAAVSYTGLANSYCSNATSVTLTGSPAGGNFSGTGVSGNQFNPATAGAGTHTVTYTTTSGGCTYTKTQSVTVNNCTSIKEVNTSGFNFYPNPVGDILYLTFSAPKGGAQITITDVTGKTLISEIADDKQQEINVSTFPKGVYFITIKSNGSTLSKRFVKA